VDEKRARQLWTRAYLQARDWGFFEEAEDLAQEVMLKYANGYSQHQWVRHTMMDVIRKLKGDDRSKCYGTKELIWHDIPMDDFSKPKPPVPPPDHASKIDRDILEKHLSYDAMARLIWKLIFTWGMNQQEIADLLELNPATVCRIVREAREHLTTKVGPRA
jgi:RNA polymerase sigma factor (sigma-70 family)